MRNAWNPACGWCARCCRALSGEEDFGRAASLETVIRLLERDELSSRGRAAHFAGQQRWQLQRLLRRWFSIRRGAQASGWNLKQIRRVAWNRERTAFTGYLAGAAATGNRFFRRHAAGETEQRFVADMGLLDSAIVTLSAFAGLLMENTTRGYGWRFLNIGRRLERAVAMPAVARQHGRGCGDLEPYLQMLLYIADSSITYRTRYFTDCGGVRSGTSAGG